MSAYSVIGAVAVAGLIYKFLSTVWIIVYPHLLAKRLGHVIDLKALGQWAVITGSTDGIGKGYAKQLAKRGLNVFLISRSGEKLNAVAEEIQKLAPTVEVRTLVIDFTQADVATYQTTITDALKDIEIGVLVNNVGMTQEYPEQFLKITNGDEFLKDILYVNCLSAIQMTRIVLPSMISRGKGAVVNISSSLAINPAPYLTVYSATKAFLDYFSRGIRSEYADSGVIFQTVYPFYVSTKMSGIKKRSFFVIDPDEFAAGALNTVGLVDMTCGCFPHELQGEIAKLVPSFLLTTMIKNALKAVRSKYLRKQGKDQEQKKEE